MFSKLKLLPVLIVALQGASAVEVTSERQSLDQFFSPANSAALEKQEREMDALKVEHLLTGSEAKALVKEIRAVADVYLKSLGSLKGGNSQEEWLNYDSAMNRFERFPHSLTASLTALQHLQTASAVLGLALPTAKTRENQDLLLRDMASLGKNVNTLYLHAQILAVSADQTAARAHGASGRVTEPAEAK